MSFITRKPLEITDQNDTYLVLMLPLSSLVPTADIIN